MAIDRDRYGPWAIIPGGSEGIGACIARDLAKSGINSVLIARKPEPLALVAEEVRALGAEVRTLSLDMTAPDMLARVREITDELDVGLLVYNSGASHRTGPLIGWPLEDMLRVIRLNVEGQAILSHHFAQRMARRGKGGIVLMGSLAGVAASPSVVAYAGAKAFSQIFAEGLWCEMKPLGVDVLHVVVGQTDTPAMARLGIVYEDSARDSPESVARLTLDNIANGPVVVVPKMAERFSQLTNPDRRALAEANAAFILANTEGTWDDS